MPTCDEAFLKAVLNTLTFDAVRKKTAGSHMVLHRNISTPVRVMNRIKVSKDAESLVVCTQKNFFGLGMQFFCE